MIYSLYPLLKVVSGISLHPTLDEDAARTRLDSKRAKVVINALAELMYQNRGDDTVTKDFPYSLRCIINQLKYSY